MKLNWFWRGIVFFGTKSNQTIWSTSHRARAGQQPRRKNAKFCGFYVAQFIYYICMGRTGERVFKLLKKCAKASITCQVPCRQPRIVSKDWNLCAEETQHMQNPSVLWRQYDARSKFSQVDIMGYPTEPYYPYPYYPTDALLSLFLLSYWCIVLQWYDINAKMRLRSKVVNSSHQKCSWFDNLGQSGIWTCSYHS